jgi:hypothetical protein
MTSIASAAADRGRPARGRHRPAAAQHKTESADRRQHRRAIIILLRGYGVLQPLELEIYDVLT